jgi:hypothetical protein
MTRKDQQRVDSRLREEAKHARDEMTFSPLLHQRLMTALHQHGLAAEELPLRRYPWLWRVGLPLAAAAVVALATWLLLRPATEKPASRIVENPHPPTPAPSVLPVPEIPGGTASQDLAEFTTQALDRGKFAYLDRDAERLLTFVARQLPGLPTPQP